MGVVLCGCSQVQPKVRRFVFDRNTFGCWGGGVGLGFGNQYLNFPGGIECFYYFLSNGNENLEFGKRVAKNRKVWWQRIC